MAFNAIGFRCIEKYGHKNQQLETGLKLFQGEKIVKSKNWNVVRKLLCLLLFAHSFNSYAAFSDFLIHYRVPGFLHYCVKNGPNPEENFYQYNEEHCQEHYNKPYSQDFIWIYSPAKNKITVEARINWGKGRETNVTAHGFYNKFSDKVKLNSFEPSEWDNGDETVDSSTGLLKNTCEVSIRRRNNKFEFKPKVKLGCNLPEQFLWTVGKMPGVRIKK